MFEISQRLAAYGSLQKLALLAAMVSVVIAGPSLSAQIFVVLHDFTGGNDGSGPSAGLTPDAGGGFYGTTSTGGAWGIGTAYRFWRTGDSWHFQALYAFDGLNNLRDGFAPYAGLVIGSDGSLYGTTHAGGQGSDCAQRYGCGTVFRISPGANIGAWDEAVLHGFGYSDGSNPDHGDLVFDHAGNLYGTTRNGGANGQGTVFELTSNRGAWTETVLHSFGEVDGASPLSGVVFDGQGNLYGTTSAGGADGMGTVYRLQPSGAGWGEDVLYSFTNGIDGSTPVAGLIVDTSGNLYGAQKPEARREAAPSSNSQQRPAVAGVSPLSSPCLGRLPVDLLAISSWMPAGISTGRLRAMAPKTLDRSSSSRGQTERGVITRYMTSPAGWMAALRIAGWYSTPPVICMEQLRRTEHTARA